MIAVILGILKTIGFVLGVLLAVIAVLCVLILFVPVRYRMEDGIKNGEGPGGTWSFSWLFKFLQCFYLYGQNENDGGENGLVVKIAVFTLGRRRKKTEAPRGQDAGKKTAEPRAGAKGAPPGPAEDEDEWKERPAREKKFIFHRLKRVYNRAVFVIQYPERREIAALTLAYIKKIWRAAKPGSFRARGRLGLGDPALTGLALGAVNAVSALLGLDVRINGDFELAVYDVETEIIGKLTLFTVLLPTLRFVLARPVWKIVRPVLFGKEEEDEH